MDRGVQREEKSGVEVEVKKVISMPDMDMSEEPDEAGLDLPLEEEPE